MTMKPFSNLIAARVAVAPAILMALASGTAASGAKPGPRRAGAAAVDITPKQFPLNMPGGFSPNMATSAHDPLHARALVLDDSDTTLALVVVDNLGIPRETGGEAKALASQRCGIKPEKILVCATHTHSAPPSNATSGPPAAVAYRKVLVEGIADAIVRAHAALRPAAVGAAAHPLPDEVFNRRWFLKPGKMPLNPFGKMDQVKMNPGTSPDVLDRPAGPTAEQIAAAKAVLAVKDEAERAHLPRLAEHYARNTLAAAERREETLTVQLHALRIGDLALCGIPFETFCEIGIELKKRSPFPVTMVIGLANARHGYLPTPEQHKLGGYETWIGTNSVQEDASVILTENLLNMLAELAKAK